MWACFRVGRTQSRENAETQDTSAMGARASVVRWPPPGLERLQGDVWNVVRSGTLAALILVFPLLLSISLRQDFWSLGPLSIAWWVILITTGVGLWRHSSRSCAFFGVPAKPSTAGGINGAPWRR
mgnify:CR=1 FL=1